MNSNQGYRHALYADSFCNITEPVFLGNSGGWILRRSISGSRYYDASGCYPLFICEDWEKMEKDLVELEQNRLIVSLALVVDPLSRPSDIGLLRIFNHASYPYKKHYLIDLGDDPWKSISVHHRRNANKALNHLEVEFCDEPTEYSSEWVLLYSNLIRRHGIKGMAAFSEDALRQQLSVPGVRMIRALYNQEVVGLCLWMVDGQKAWYHLAAYSQTGYQMRASFALFNESIRQFQLEGVNVINLGGGAGVQENSDDGLTRFKRGWSNLSEDAYFCAHVVDRSAYAELSDKFQGLNSSDFFPAYRLSTVVVNE